MKNYYVARSLLFLLEARIFTLLVFFNFDETNSSIFFSLPRTRDVTKEEIEEGESKKSNVFLSFLFFSFSPLEIITISRFN